MQARGEEAAQTLPVGGGQSGYERILVIDGQGGDIPFFACTGSERRHPQKSYRFCNENAAIFTTACEIMRLRPL
jgi:hypothetical protein